MLSTRWNILAVYVKLHIIKLLIFFNRNPLLLDLMVIVLLNFTLTHEERYEYKRKYFLSLWSFRKYNDV